MPKGYTSNQTGAIACLLASFMWGLTAYAYASMSQISHPVYTIFIIAGWILLPFYVRLRRFAFIVGIFILVVPMCYLAFLTELLGTAPWFTFSRGLYDFTYVVWFLISIACIYFSYQTFRELSKNGHVKLKYTYNQTGAIACVLASVIWGLTAYAVAIIFGTSSPLYAIFVIIAWIIALSYITLLVHVFIAGIFWSACSMLYLLITPSILGTSEWYLLERGLFDFTYFIWYLISIAVIYFSYKSWKELQK